MLSGVSIRSLLESCGHTVPEIRRLQNSSMFPETEYPCVQLVADPNSQPHKNRTILFDLNPLCRVPAVRLGVRSPIAGQFYLHFIDGETSPDEYTKAVRKQDLRIVLRLCGVLERTTLVLGHSNDSCEAEWVERSIWSPPYDVDLVMVDA